jgi:Tfp pilus assembly protein PilO
MSKLTKRLSRNTKTALILSLVLALAAFAFYTRKQISAVKSATSAQAAAQASLNNLQVELKTAESGGITAISKLTTQAALAKQVLPSSAPTVQLVNAISNQASSSGLTMTALAKGPSTTGPSGCLSYQPYTLTVTGSLSSMINWVTAVQNFTPGANLPLLTLSGVSIGVAGGHGGQSVTGTTQPIVANGAYSLTATLKAWYTSSVAPTATAAPSLGTSATSSASC